MYPNSGFSTWGKGKREHLKHIGEGICDIGCGKYLEVHEQVQELEDIADSFPALGWETLLVSRVLQGHDDNLFNLIFLNFEDLEGSFHYRALCVSKQWV